LGDIQQHFYRTVCIETPGFGWFHCRILLTPLVQGKSQNTVFRAIQFFETGASQSAKRASGFSSMR